MCKGSEVRDRRMVKRLCLERELSSQAGLEAWAGGLQGTGHIAKGRGALLKAFVWEWHGWICLLRNLVALEGRTKKKAAGFEPKPATGRYCPGAE